PFVIKSLRFVSTSLCITKKTERHPYCGIAISYSICINLALPQNKHSNIGLRPARYIICYLSLSVHCAANRNLIIISLHYYTIILFHYLSNRLPYYYSIILLHYNTIPLP